MTAVAEAPAAGTLDSDAASAGTDLPTRTEHTATRRRVPGRVFSKAAAWVGTLLVILTGLTLLAMTVTPRVFHYRTATMLTGSMVPTINPGDVIVDTEESVSALSVGQIITYHIPVEDHRVESHRVTWVRHNADGSVLFRTQGDANNGADPWTAKAPANSKVWIVRTVLPVVGDVIRFLRRPAVSFLFTRIVPGLILLSALYAIWQPSRRSSRREPEAS
jgi:signal peptidase